MRGRARAGAKNGQDAWCSCMAGRYNEAGRKVMVGHVLREERQKMLLHLAGLEQELLGNSEDRPTLTLGR